MDNDSGDRFNQVQDGENNDSGEQIPIILERHRNEEKDSLANRKQESQSRGAKRKKKIRKRKVSTSREIQIFHQLTLLFQQKRKRKSIVGNIINRHRHLFQLSGIQIPMRNCIMIDLKLSLKIVNLNGNYPKSMAKYANKYFEKSVPKQRLYYTKTPSQTILKCQEVRRLFKGYLERKTYKQTKRISKMFWKNFSEKLLM